LLEHTDKALALSGSLGNAVAIQALSVFFVFLICLIDEKNESREKPNASTTAVSINNEEPVNSDQNSDLEFLSQSESRTFMNRVYSLGWSHVYFLSTIFFAYMSLQPFTQNVNLYM
jgi:hypothetical protein